VSHANQLSEWRQGAPDARAGSSSHPLLLQASLRSAGCRIASSAAQMTLPAGIIAIAKFALGACNPACHAGFRPAGMSRLKIRLLQACLRESCFLGLSHSRSENLRDEAVSPPCSLCPRWLIPKLVPELLA